MTYEATKSVTKDLKINELQKINNSLLNACKFAYRKHWMGDDTIGWNELGDVLHEAICNAIGDDGFLQWLDKLREPSND